MFLKFFQNFPIHILNYSFFHLSFNIFTTHVPIINVFKNKITNENIDVDRLLVVTFTNAAATEMRERILEAIYKKIEALISRR